MQTLYLRDNSLIIATFIQYDISNLLLLPTLNFMKKH